MYILLKFESLRKERTRKSFKKVEQITRIYAHTYKKTSKRDTKRALYALESLIFTYYGIVILLTCSF